jgi:hypothetical protein
MTSSSGQAVHYSDAHDGDAHAVILRTALPRAARL